jgi:glycosyltransferase involved in cell wall biosynthesis
MIVRNDAYMRGDAHIVQNTLDSVAPHISSWVIVDTGSDDGTQDLIRNHMGRLGIPGQLHERTWCNFGQNRTEAIDLAQGHGDYVWVVDADDVLVGVPDFTELSADAYALRYLQAGRTGWRTRLFRDGKRWRYEGALLEIPSCEDPFVVEQLDGAYRIEDRPLGARSRDSQRYTRETDSLLADVERNPEDRDSVILLAESYFNQGDFGNARKWYGQRLDMGTLRPTEESFFVLYRFAESMSRSGESWPAVQDAYLKAWEFRRTRAEPLYTIAFRYRVEREYRLGHHFAKRAAQIPYPEDDMLVAHPDIYAWLAADEQAVCASWIDKHPEAFSLCRRILDRNDLSDEQRRRIAINRDYSVPTMVEAASAYPDALIGELATGARDAEVTVSLIAGPDRETAEQTLNSFLNCCGDLRRVGRFLVLDAGLSARDRSDLQDRYGFLEFADLTGNGSHLGQIRSHVQGRFWLHLGHGWRFFAPEDLISRLTAVLAAETQVFQVGINLADATKLTGECAVEDAVRRAPGTGRYLLSEAVASGPAMFETTRLDRIGAVASTDGDLIAKLRQPASTAGLVTATLDQVLCQDFGGGLSATMLSKFLSPTPLPSKRIHRFCLAHKEPLLPESWYDDCIALGSYQAHSVSHISKLDRYWHEARPIAFGAAGAYAVPAAIERFAEGAELIELSSQRKRVLLSPEGVGSQVYRTSTATIRELSTEECRARTDISPVIMPPNDSGFLVSHPRYYELPLSGLYNREFHFVDILDYTSIAIELGVLDNKSAAEFMAIQKIIPAGTELGIFPTSWLISALTKLEKVGREFLDRHGDRIRTYNIYQVRAVGFLSECLGSFLLLRHLAEQHSGNIPANVFGYMTCITEDGQPFQVGVADAADLTQPS